MVEALGFTNFHQHLCTIQIMRGRSAPAKVTPYRSGGEEVVVVAGSIKIGTIKATNPHAAHPIGRLHLPKFHGPGRKRCPTKNTRMKIGMVKAT